MKNIKYKNLPATAPLTKIHADDYTFESGYPKPWTEDLGTKQDFENGEEIQDYISEGGYKNAAAAFKDIAAGSGDGDENYHFLTILDGKIVAVIP